MKHWHNNVLVIALR